MEPPVTQATAHNNTVVVYPEKVEIRSGWQNQNVETIPLREISRVTTRGLVNCTLLMENNQGRIYRLERMALPDARAVKNAIEQQRRKAGLYE